MNEEHTESCCPTDPGEKALWEEKNLQEQEQITLMGTGLKSQESLLKCLGHANRLLILRYLDSRANCACELVFKLQATNSATSYHLGYLTKQGLVKAENRAGQVYYFLTQFGRDVLEWLDSQPSNDGAR